MSVSSRLKRLGTGASTAAPPGAGPLPAQATELQEKLARLRCEMRAALGRELPKKQIRVPLSVLPFERLETAYGGVLLRREIVAAGSGVGNVVLKSLLPTVSHQLARLGLCPELANTEPERWLFFDTETTGLSGSGALAFLVGLAWMREDGSVSVQQLLLGEPDQEPGMLEHVRSEFETAGAVVSFNGKSFDQPLLTGRCVLNQLSALPQKPHLDLLHVARRIHRPRLSACSLQSMERHVLAFDRGPDIDGSEIPSVYSEFLRSGEAQHLQRVVEHNYWDLLTMVALVQRYARAREELSGDDLPSLAKTLYRAGELSGARAVADDACRRRPSREALRVRARVAKAEGNHRSATLDWEALCAACDDEETRLELAKVYEHVWKQPEVALSWAERGTGESGDLHARRLERLRRKIMSKCALEQK